MSRSNPPASTIVDEGQPADTEASENRRSGGRSSRRTFAIRFAALMRWLHIYLSMFGLAVVLFFSLTGITLNHPDWFAETSQRSVESKGTLDLAWIQPVTSRGDATTSENAVTDDRVDKLQVVEFLRKTHGIRGALSDFHVDESECTVTFKGPGYSADVLIDRASGEYQLTELSHGLIAILNDLHKGRDTGVVWSALIDITAIVLSLISMTGLVLLCYLKRRRISGLVVSVIGALLILALVSLFVP